MIYYLIALVVVGAAIRLGLWLYARPGRRAAQSLCLYCFEEYTGFQRRCPACGKANDHSGWTSRPGMRSAWGAEDANGQPLGAYRISTWWVFAALLISSACLWGLWRVR